MKDERGFGQRYLQCASGYALSSVLKAMDAVTLLQLSHTVLISTDSLSTFLIQQSLTHTCQSHSTGPCL